MPIRQEIEVTLEAVQVTVFGELLDEDLLDLYGVLQECESLASASALILDLRHVDARRVTAGAIRNVAELPPLLPGEAAFAVLVSSDLGVGLTRMYQILRDGSQRPIGVFEEISEAHDWLRTRE